MLAISGGSGFIGGIIAGFLAGYLTQELNITRKLPQAIEGLKPTLIIHYFQFHYWIVNGVCLLIRQQLG